MLPGAAEQVAGDSGQQVVLAKFGDVEQRQHDVEPGLRSERLGRGYAAVQLDHGGWADLGQAVVERGDRIQSVSSAAVARAWQAAMAACSA